MTDIHNLMLSDDEINKLLEKTLRENPVKYPYVVVHVWLAHLIARKIGKLNEELTDCMKKLEGYINGKE